MDAILTGEKSAEHGKRLGLRALLLGIGALTLLVIVGGYIWARFIYEPDLAVYSVTFLDTRGHQLRDLTLKQPDAFEDRSTAVIPYEQDGVVVVHYWLNNSASFDPTIEEIPVGMNPHSASLLSPEKVYVGTPPRGGDGFALENFHPFVPTTIPKGRGIAILVVYRVGNCRFTLPGGSVEVTGLPVTYSMLGVVHEVVLDPLENLAVVSPPKKDCPERSDD